VITTTAKDVEASTLLPFVKEMVLPSSLVFTDELQSYNGLGKAGYMHKHVQHALGVYVYADAHTNTVEGFLSLFKRSVDGAHHTISVKYMQNYLNEYTFRWNHRNDENPMFVAFLGQHRSDHGDKANARIRT
jgi:transposase